MLYGIATQNRRTQDYNVTIQLQRTEFIGGRWVQELSKRGPNHGIWGSPKSWSKM